jgi:2-polyprenyl-3-methyl-5-hydroxy-6-metoxy-1,4-benzoquinol methylase
MATISNPCMPPLTADELQVVAHQRYGPDSRRSAYMRAQSRLGYSSPAEHYEALLNRLIGPETSWLDIGCGRAPFPNNAPLCKELSSRCKWFAGVDPDEGIQDNPYLHERAQVRIEDYHSERTYDLVSLRMVVEHVDAPDHLVSSLRRLTHDQSAVVIHTVNWWSLTTLASHFTPLGIHHLAKRWLWNSKERDTFSTHYKMNRRAVLDRIMSSGGFRKVSFAVVPDATLFWKFPVARDMELRFWKATKLLGLPYIDTCILAVYART